MRGEHLSCAKGLKVSQRAQLAWGESWFPCLWRRGLRSPCGMRDSAALRRRESYGRAKIALEAAGAERRCYVTPAGAVRGLRLQGITFTLSRCVLCSRRSRVTGAIGHGRRC
eukprot:6200968-Pleurochrysis_carterae.AAC.1